MKCQQNLITLQARERLAECYGVKGEFDKALDQINQILVLAPGGQKALSAKPASRALSVGA